MPIEMSQPSVPSRRRPAGVTKQPAAAKTNLGFDPLTESFVRSTLDSLSAHIAVLDLTGTIVAVNKSWRSFAQQSGYAGSDDGVGTNYLRVCEAGAPSSEDAARTADALRDILAGRRSEFRMEYPCTGPEGPRWFQVRITRPEPITTSRIVVAHEDITEVKRAHEELAHLTTRLMQLQDEERRSIARELHDTTAQNLLAVTLNMTRLKERLRNASSPVHRILTETVDLAEQSLQEVRTLSYLLHPPLLDDVGLGSALRWLAEGFSERSGVKVHAIVGEGLDKLPREVATALFRVAQECLANVHRHSGSTWAEVDIHRVGDVVRLEVRDGGCGFVFREGRDSDGVQGTLGVGISGMRVRLQQLGGNLEINGGNAGTRVIATVSLGL
jgi:two-component system NarL family sensor kinase